jgi:OOP family OmpA-OmpF porin
MLKHKTTLLALLSASLLASAGCGATDKSCMAINSWAQPVWGCGAPEPPAPEPEPEPEPVPEPEPEPERVQRKGDKIVILEKVQFETGSAEIKPESYGLLDEVAKVLTDNPDITKVQIEGHTDNRGGAALNRRLSKNRAKSVRKYLVDKGIDGGRLTAKGFGPDQPIADNDSDEGRAQNRRVEFKILEQGDSGM